MATLIDGYNLIFAVGMLGRNIGPRTLERARLALLNFLVNRLGDADRAETTVVFDAKEAPPGLPDKIVHGDIQVRFARGYTNADELLQELIRADAAPRKLVVVSSDHQVQLAARRRRAKAVDSEQWYDDLKYPSPVEQDSIDKELGQKPIALPTEAEVDLWLREFGDHAAPAAISENDTVEPESPAPSSTDSELANPFPPGYAEDLLDPEELHRRD
jgi:predicted RNA-binding protein with PIN domain